MAYPFLSGYATTLHLLDIERGGRDFRLPILLCRLGWRNLRRQRLDPLIIRWEHSEEAPLPGIRERRSLILPQVVTDDLVRTTGPTSQMRIDDF